MKGPLDVHLALLEGAVPHEIVHLARAVHSSDELPEVLGVPAAACLVVRVYQGPDGPLAVVRPAHADDAPPADAVELHPDEVSAMTDFAAALLPPVCLPRTLQPRLGAGLEGSDIVYAATGDGGTALKIRYRDLVRVTGARPLAVDLRDPTHVGQA